MRECWRWFGPLDRITLPQIAQTGASGIVTALHDIPAGEVWPRAAIDARRALIDTAGLGLHWAVVESLPVHDRIKRGEGDLAPLFANYRTSLENLAAAGIETVCYNFMTVIDWVRTDHDLPMRGGALALGFSTARMAAFERHMLGRDIGSDYPPEAIAQGDAWFAASSQADRQALLGRIMAGLPGSYDRFSVAGLRAELARYEGQTKDRLRSNLGRFLDEVIPTAERLGMRLCIHPDDPPRPVFGLARIVSTEEDLDWIISRADSPANGLTFCSGALGASRANDLGRIARRFAAKVHFLHLRSVATADDGSFHEAAHLEGEADLPDLVAIFLHEEARRRAEGRSDADLPFRPDHGHEMLSDIGAGAHPGYPLIGRLRGLAELRGVIAATRLGQG
jgi:mannonate dehydratase